MNTVPPSITETSGDTADKGKLQLYADRVRVYPARVAGPFRRFKWFALIVLLGIYYAAPWLRWDRGPGAPDQALLIDMPSRISMPVGQTLTHCRQSTQWPLPSQLSPCLCLPRGSPRQDS